MLQQTCPNDWHQIFLVASGFLTATLVVWIQFWVRSLYEKLPTDNRSFEDRSFSVHTAILWLFVGVLFALFAFGLTGLDWLFTHQKVQLATPAYQIDLMEQLAACFLMSSFNITLIAVIQQIINAGATLKRKGESEPINYGRHPNERTHNKRFLFGGICVALALVWTCCLFLAFTPLPLIPWLLRALLSVLYPGLILWATYKGISIR